jgi:hypothetical protein
MQRQCLATVAVAFFLTACELSPADIAWVDEAAMPTPRSADGLTRFAPPPLPEDSSLLVQRTFDDWVGAWSLADDEAPALRSLAERLDAMPESRLERPAGLALPALEVPPAPDQPLGQGPAPADADRCGGSLRLVKTARGDVAAWWSRRDGSRVHLLAAWRYAGDAEWRGPIAVDTLDQGSRDARDVPEGIPTGCDRPAPGLSVDAENGYVHLAYALVGPEGPGFFYAHQMDPRAAFEPPQPIVYGERLGMIRVASDGDVVAVAYEDPNSGARRRIALAVSRTAGHLWERRHTVSSGINGAADPIVTVRGTALVVGWTEVAPTGGAPMFLTRRAIVR